MRAVTTIYMPVGTSHLHSSTSFKPASPHANQLSPMGSNVGRKPVQVATAAAGPRRTASHLAKHRHPLADVGSFISLVCWLRKLTGSRASMDRQPYFRPSQPSQGTGQTRCERGDADGATRSVMLRHTLGRQKTEARPAPGNRGSDKCTMPPLPGIEKEDDIELAAWCWAEEPSKGEQLLDKPNWGQEECHNVGTVQVQRTNAGPNPRFQSPSSVPPTVQ
ncbi:hypothetical protein CTA2_1647 [Colletotrichum tanaceti]|uniref:Uncharacterized protein n=1 Tax=Colletotrichum tanaceti TaxID=1306861 RepID=A0A4U6XUR8_9PEZI|nr:hypothetical protein CTA2_1647 [Colletotrichum tanaceti]TKW59783.1 hypothetical protein CTA1_10461 [Colletotrichum tanaceti]